MSNTKQILFNDHFQNFKKYNLHKAQLIIADVPYNLGNNALCYHDFILSLKEKVIMKIKNLKGKVFGNLKVISKAENKNANSAWLCKCECGNRKIILGSNLIHGRSKSCGCLQKQNASAASKTHGESKTRLYFLYKGIKQRCLNKNNHAYKYYGGRGIELCAEWREDFMSFKNWAYDNGYEDGATIDRVDPNGNYSPENCRWVNIQKQQNNKLNSFFLTINNEKLTIAEWATKKRINKQTLYSKFYRLLESLELQNKKGIVFKITFTK